MDKKSVEELQKDEKTGCELVEQVKKQTIDKLIEDISLNSPGLVYSTNIRQLVKKYWHLHNLAEEGSLVATIQALQQLLYESRIPIADLLILLLEFVNDDDLLQRNGQWVVINIIIWRIYYELTARTVQLERSIEHATANLPPDIAGLSDYLEKLSSFNIISNEMLPTLQSPVFCDAITFTLGQVKEIREYEYYKGFQAGKRAVLDSLKVGRPIDLD